MVKNITRWILGFCAIIALYYLRTFVFGCLQCQQCLQQCPASQIITTINSQIITNNSQIITTNNNLPLYVQFPDDYIQMNIWWLYTMRQFREGTGGWLLLAIRRDPESQLGLLLESLSSGWGGVLIHGLGHCSGSLWACLLGVWFALVRRLLHWILGHRQVSHFGSPLALPPLQVSSLLSGSPDSIGFRSSVALGRATGSRGGISWG